MRTQKILKRLAIIFLIGCAIFIAIDVFKVFKINIDFMGMQSSDRISSSSNAPEVRYESTDYIITNKEEALQEIKKLTLKLKDEYNSFEKKEKLFEIGNIHKIKNLFYNYEKYAVVKYKLLNIIEDLPNLYKATSGKSNSQLESYFAENSIHIENYYGITQSSDFINFTKSLSFLDNTRINSATLQTATISFDYDNDILNFNIKLKTDSGDSEDYFINIDYYKSSDNQIAPYLVITD